MRKYKKSPRRKNIKKSFKKRKRVYKKRQSTNYLRGKNKKIYMMTRSLSTRDQNNPGEFIDTSEWIDTVMEDYPDLNNTLQNVLYNTPDAIQEMISIPANLINS